MTSEVRPALVIFLLLTVVTGLLYPGVVYVAGRLFFAQEATGSVVERDGQAVGSRLLGQTFTSPKYFWGRPSATTPTYNGAASTGSNQATTNPALIAAVKDRVTALRAADPGNTKPIPVDLVTASGSGLDPEISPAAAYYQAPRVARARGLDETQVENLVQKTTVDRTLGLFGEPRVNVMELNLALDAIKK